MEFSFLHPLASDLIYEIDAFSSQHFGSKVVFHTEDAFPDIDKIKIAIIGVLENRGDINAIEEVDLSTIRKELYGLFPGNWNASIADLGDIYPGNSVEDTYFALKKVVASLIKKKIIPIIIGGSQDLVYPLIALMMNWNRWLIW